MPRFVCPWCSKRTRNEPVVHPSIEGRRFCSLRCMACHILVVIEGLAVMLDYPPTRDR